jgi:tetratricopeptide (TPR) repeat protein
MKHVLGFCLLWIFCFLLACNSTEKQSEKEEQVGQAQEEKKKEILNQVITLLEEGREEEAEDYMNDLGDDKTVLNSYIELGIDLHHAGKLDQSMQINQLGVKAAFKKGNKKAAAIMLHNIAAFCAPEFDEKVTEKCQKNGFDAAQKALELRKELGEKGPLAWAYWDMGLYYLIKKDADHATQHFLECIKVAEEANDPLNVAWGKVFLGKTKLKLIPERKEEGLKDLKEAKAIFEKEKGDWGLEEVGKILTKYSSE